MEQSFMEGNENNSSFDVKRFLTKILKNYLWFIVSIVTFAGAAWAYLRYSVPLYQVATFIQVQQPNDAAAILGGSPFSSNGNANARNYPDINGEIFKLQSAALIGEVVDSLRLDIAVTTKGKLQDMPVALDQLPFTIDVGRMDPKKQSVTYNLQLTSDSYLFKTDHQQVKGIYGEPLLLGGDTVMLRLRDLAGVKPNKTWQVRFLSRTGAIALYTGRLTVGQVPKGGMGMIQLVMRDEIPQRAQKIVNVLINKYDLANYLFKNKALRSEIQWLDNRLATVNEELNTQENYVRNFKANNKINDVSSSANQLLSSLTSIDTKKSDNDYKENLLKLIENNINNNNGKEERINVPGLQDGDLIALVGKYNDLVSQKATILEQAAPLDLRLPPINAKIESTKENIVNRISSIRQELATSNNFLAGQERSTTGRFVTLPEKEKDYIQVNRLLNIKQSLYVFLLQKKEDKNIEFASSAITGSRIVDWRVNGVQDPKPSMVYIGAFLAGVLIPAMIILIRFMLNKRIETPAEIYKTTTLPIAGEIAYVGKMENEMVMRPGNVSPVAEQFRTLRTNISYLNQGTPNKVLLITSGVSGEGKSFISLNLANTLAITNKKTVLIEFDLRNPSLAAHLGANTNTGIANFLTGEVELSQIIQPVEGADNLFFISAGLPLPANPGEIILKNEMQSLFEQLRQNFEFIVLDTPPIEAVSDALTLGKWADATFFVLRHKYSLRSSLVRMHRLYEDHKLPRPALIINGIKRGEGFNNVHGYGYGYGDMDKMKRKKQKVRLKIA
ncbi:polysaccharide biosynthesis tyrosine autokinase [Paraflavitalea sp. CAU 1676]|uniref:GumC family protein n=1 Tax=Paraflavitalea sp. CAU 1676 TaxID=3032598 RepID=UPI0023D97F9E|nr:polysaccharide biosynthesis tyrosine autokinase [Paraflavitalea sp. CAU 1676]MDF2189648.1 polysaccharide biosynthesis tyrosine autokinase [Paraflavitalea sp. CAU 1676]